MTRFLQAEFSVGKAGTTFRDPKDCIHGMRVKATKRCFFCDIPLDDNNQPIEPHVAVDYGKPGCDHTVVGPYSDCDQ